MQLKKSSIGSLKLILKLCKTTSKDIDRFKDAPLWDQKSIEKATSDWFKYLGK